MTDEHISNLVAYLAEHYPTFTYRRELATAIEINDRKGLPHVAYLEWDGDKIARFDCFIQQATKQTETVVVGWLAWNRRDPGCSH